MIVLLNACELFVKLINVDCFQNLSFVVVVLKKYNLHNILITNQMYKMQ